MTMYDNFSICMGLGIIFKQCHIQNCVLMKAVIDRFVCIRLSFIGSDLRDPETVQLSS